MKLIIKLSMLLLITIVYSQSPIKPLYNGDFKDVEGAYYKDVGDIHHLYVGTWLYTNGTDSLKIKLRERPMEYVSSTFANYFIDQLIGEYQYIVNGQEQINTLQNFNQEHVGVTNYNLYAFALQHKKVFPQCNECTDGEKRLVLRIQEPALSHLTGLRDKFIMRYYVENGIEKIKLWFPYYEGNIVSHKTTHTLSDINNFTVPYGEYILVKQ